MQNILITWSLRNNTNFPPDDQINGFDTLLVGGLDKVKLDINQNASYRHKPRYFYNILMSNVDTDESSWPLNDKQLAINKAYNDRGFHFYPTVESIAGSSTPIAQSFYNPGDSVYVHIKDCPQNTKVGIRVVPDVDTYTQIGAGGIAIPSAVSIGGNSVFREVKTNENGEWKGSIYFSNQLSPGEYDIIVDVGSPTTPDNRLNLVFAKDNIIDAVDGLDGAGFTVTNLGDAVVALDLSSSMDGYGTQLAKTVQAIEMSMLDNERINVFGFTEGKASENWRNGIVNIIGGDSSFYNASNIDSTQISGVMNNVAIGGNTDLYLPFFYGQGRLGSLINGNSDKCIILLSDGVHFVTPANMGNPGNYQHTIAFVDSTITTLVVPDSIRCYTICYGDSQIGITNMRRFAELGNGAFFHVQQLGDLKLYMNQLLCNIRGTAPVISSVKGIEPGATQSHDIMVEPQASELRTSVIWKSDDGGGGVS